MTIRHIKLSVKSGEFYLAKILCFGDFEIAYEEVILCTADTRAELEQYCYNHGYVLNDPSGWNEYYIGQQK